MVARGRPDQPVVVIAGIHARRVREHLMPAIERLESLGVNILAIHPLRDTPGVTDMITMMRERGVRRFIAAGGDGTIGTVANAIANTDAVLGILPLGTSNDFARSLGIPMNVAEACMIIARDSKRTIDLGFASTGGGATRYFVHATTIGLNSQFARVATTPQWRQRFGRFAYPAAAIRALRQSKAIEMRVTADGKQLRARVLQVTVLNAPLFGGALGLRVPDATLMDRRLDLLMVTGFTPRLLARAAFFALSGKRRQVSLAHLAHPRCICVETEPTEDVYCDGEFMGSTPVTIESADRALAVIV